MRYEIDPKDFTILVFVESQDPPVLKQPFWPDGTPWASIEDADSWASQYVKAAEDWREPFPPAGPGMEPTPQPEPNTVEAPVDPAPEEAPSA